MMRENEWRQVRSTSDPATGERVVLLSGVFEGVRLWCEKHWSKPHHEGSQRTLLHERFTWLNPEDVRHPGRWQSSARGALDAMAQSKLHEEQMAQIGENPIP